MNFLIKKWCSITTNCPLILRIVITMLGLLLSFNSKADSTVPMLKLSPKQCIALHQGKKCYVDIELQWRTPEIGDYCLFSSQQRSPLTCWQQDDKGEFKKEIVANQNVIFILKAHGSNKSIATVELEMAWVYKKNSRSRSSWRIF
ncbi:DUF3019 domain-containing protein [Thalassotalea sp. ND16A]|uniref:DUF3019 domain-containing protein n=1 Tax=Thalassotalea sp. ND16A TaxID=1535422 RepID=UPI00051DE501|nr:DUF3019 domain-containing protein [Thalassotalea sp. ND16A]KGJ92449.1 hypothetical protein ND16A_1627 [Thalassotalea sp. ND16A]